METEIPNWYVEQWLASALHIYQAKGFKLRPTVMPPIRIEGKTVYFRKMGKAVAEEDVQPGDVAVAQNLSRENIAVTSSKSRAFFEVDEDDMDLTQLNLPQINGEAGAMALGRSHDKLILDTLNGTSGIHEVGDYTAPGDPELLLKAKQKLMAADVPAEDGDIFAAVDSVFWNVLMSFKQFASSDYVGPELPFLRAALAKTWNGIHVFHMSDALLPVSSTTERDNLMWHRPALGFGALYTLKGTVQWDNRKSSWTHNMRQRYGAKALQAEGIVRMKADYDAAHISLSA